LGSVEAPDADAEHRADALGATLDPPAVSTAVISTNAASDAR